MMLHCEDMYKTKAVVLITDDFTILTPNLLGVRQKFMGDSCTTFGKVLTLLLVVAASAVQCSDMDESSWFMLSQCC